MIKQVSTINVLDKDEQKKSLKFSHGASLAEPNKINDSYQIASGSF